MKDKCKLPEIEGFKIMDDEDVIHFFTSKKPYKQPTYFKKFAYGIIFCIIIFVSLLYYLTHYLWV